MTAHKKLWMQRNLQLDENDSSIIYLHDFSIDDNNELRIFAASPDGCSPRLTYGSIIVRIGSLYSQTQSCLACQRHCSFLYLPGHTFGPFSC